MTVFPVRQSIDALSISNSDFIEVEEQQMFLIGGYEERRNEEDAQEAKESSGSRIQLGLIYSLHLAEAIVASSLQPQLYALLRDSQLCGNIDSVYWSGLIETIFAMGSLAGLFWGCIGDRIGRRPVALAGLFGMAVSSIAMGFSRGVLSCALIRGFAGLMGSSTRVMVWTMLGDVSDTTNAKARNFSRIPLIATGGIIGPVLQALLAHRFSQSEVWRKFPILSSQLACAGLILAFFAVNFLFLKETLPKPSRNTHIFDFSEEPYRDRISDEIMTEKDYFLGQVSIRDTPRRLSYTYNDTPKPITFAQAIRAPSLIILLCSFSFLSLHSASFDQLLPLLGNSPVEQGGLGLPCSFLALVVLGSGSASAILTYIWFGNFIQRLGLLNFYRICCWAFPLIYVLTPVLSAVSRNSHLAVLITAGSSIFTKTLFTTFAQILVVFLVTNSSPDAFSLGSIMGLMQSASVFKGLAVAGTGVAFIVGNNRSSSSSIEVVNYALWVTLAIVAIGGAALAYFVQDRPRVNRDYMAESLKWEICYESMDSEDDLFSAYADSNASSISTVV